MWVDSKRAADVLGVKYDALVKSVKRAEKQGKKFCTIKPNILSFIYVEGIGRGGKVLQIWVDEQSDKSNAGVYGSAKKKSEATKDTNKGANNENISNTAINGFLGAKGLQGNSVSTKWQGEYQGSEALQSNIAKDSFTKRESGINDENNITNEQNGANSDRGLDEYSEYRRDKQDNQITNIAKCDKTGNQTQEKSMDKSCQSRINGEINDTQDKQNLGEIRRGVLPSGKHNNADMGVAYMARDNILRVGHPNAFAPAEQSPASAALLKPHKWGTPKSEATKDKNNELEELFNATNIADDKKADAYMKAKICKIWLKNKEKISKIQGAPRKSGALVKRGETSFASKTKSIDAFLSYINLNKMYDKKVSKGLMYDWLRRYENGGIKALVDTRGGNKPLSVELLGYKEKIDELIMASGGKITAYNVYNRFHHTCVQMGLLTHDEFISKEKYILSYDNINRYVNKWKKENPTTALYIEKGYDGAINSKLGAVGKANWKADFANEYVEIDATTLDMFAKKINLDLASEIWKINKDAFRDFDECKERVAENQKRYTVVGMIDVFSGVCSYHIGKSENIYSVKRCLAKYIAKFGKPITVVGDNGKAFKSHEMQGTFDSLDIAYQAVRAYSGWLKPYIERSWRSFQDNFSQNLAGFIGHSVVQRQAIEFGFSKMERRLKKGEQTNLKRMLLISDLGKLMDDYVDEFINQRWMDRLGKSPLEAYKMCEDKVQKLSSMVVCARLGKMLTKKVHKKGIIHDNAYYVCAKSFAFDAVKIVPNINNVDEVYIWSVLGEFIGVGTRLNDGEGVSAEIAKEARSFSKNKIDKARKAVNKATITNQDSFVEHVQYVKSLRVCEDGNAALEYEDELTAKIKTEHKRAKSLRVVSELLMPAGVPHNSGALEKRGETSFASKPKSIEISWEGMLKK